MLSPVISCAGCDREAPEHVDQAGYRRTTPPGWYWLTQLGEAGKWYFCSLDCAGRWLEIAKRGGKLR